MYGTCKELWRKFVLESVLCQAIWNYCNNISFNKTQFSHFLQVVLKTIRFHLYHVKERESMDFGCNRMETLAYDIFNQYS
jgi:hypothetical protein